MGIFNICIRRDVDDFRRLDFLISSNLPHPDKERRGKFMFDTLYGPLLGRSDKRFDKPLGGCSVEYNFRVQTFGFAPNQWFVRVL